VTAARIEIDELDLDHGGSMRRRCSFGSSESAGKRLAIAYPCQSDEDFVTLMKKLLNTKSLRKIDLGGQRSNEVRFPG
jgi:hypothetical protein